MEETVFLSGDLAERLSALRKNRQSCLMLNEQQIPLVSKITIGRDRKNSIVVPDGMVSHFHAVIQKIKDDYYIKDLGSTNGTFVNNLELPEGNYVKLESNDTIRIGRTDLTLVLRKD